MVIDVLSEVKEIKLQLKNNHQQTKKNEQTDSIFNNKDLNFPLQTEENLQEVERILKNEDEIIKAVIKVSLTEICIFFI